MEFYKVLSTIISIATTIIFTILYYCFMIIKIQYVSFCSYYYHHSHASHLRPGSSPRRKPRKSSWASAALVEAFGL